MDKASLLMSIAKTGYNVGFGAKKHFATYDMVEKIPGFFNFLSLAVGTYALVFKSLSVESISATFIVLGIIGLYMSFYDPKKAEYEQAGVALTKLFNRLEKLYSSVKSAPDNALDAFKAELAAIEGEYYATGISKQILFSDWWAHYKFFWQHQIGWVDEQLNFKFFRDKIPLSLTLSFFFALVFFLYLLCSGFIYTEICNLKP